MGQFINLSKRIFAVLLSALTLTLCFTACGEQPSKPLEKNPPKADSSKDELSNESSDRESSEKYPDNFSSSLESSLPDVEEWTGNIEKPSDEKIKELIEKEARNGKINLKVWVRSADRKFVNGITEKFATKYKIDGITYNIKVESCREDMCIPELIEEPTSGADVFQFTTDHFLIGVQSGALAEVPTIYQGSITADNMPEAIESCKNGDKLYAYPMSCDDGYFLFYDKSVFTEDDVKSFESLLAKAESQGYNVLMPFESAWYNAGFFYASGCDIQLDAVTSKMKLVDFASDKGVNAVKAMIDLSKSKSMINAVDDTVIENELSKGKLKAVVTGTWNTAKIKEAFGEKNFAATKLPTAKIGGQDTQLHSFGGFKLVGVKKSTKYPVTSATLASFMTSEEMQLERYYEGNMIPTNNKARENDAVKSNPTTMAIEAQRPYSHSQPCTQNFWGPISDIATKKSLEGYNSDSDILNGLKNAVSLVEG